MILKGGTGFDLLYFRRFWALQKTLFPRAICDTSGLLCLLLAVSGVEQFLIFKVGLISGKFYEVLGNKDSEAFGSHVGYSLGLIGGMVLVRSLRDLVTNGLVVRWRCKLTKALHKNYFDGLNFYFVNVFNRGNIDNPDQRISSDVDLLCTNYGTIIDDIVVAPFTIAYYTYSAYTRAGWIGPTSIFGFFLISSIIIKLLMSPIVRMTMKREKMEGEFRFRHAILRSNAESLAFFGNEAVATELTEANNKLKKLCAVQLGVYKRQFVLNLATFGFNYVGSIASFLIISIPIFAGKYDDLTQPELSRIISENAFVSIYLIYQFSKLVDLSVAVSTIAGVTHRIGELIETLAAQQTHPKAGDKQLQVKIDPTKEFEHNEVFKVENLNLFAPGSQVCLVRNLNLALNLGRNLLIMGNSSTGKTSLLRIIQGLWQVPDGSKVIFFNHQEKFFIPQKMFLSEGCSLRRQVTFPKHSKNSLIDQEEETTIRRLLFDLELSHLIKRCGDSLDAAPTFSWNEELSPGEMQRLCFARLFYHKPKVVILDEATSALSTGMEEKIYERCIADGITIVSVGHRNSLRKFHHLLLELGLHDGGWKLTTLNDNV